MNGLTNKELETYGKKFLGKSFLGVYPCDSHPRDLNKLKNKSFSFIFLLACNEVETQVKNPPPCNVIY